MNNKPVAWMQIHYKDKMCVTKYSPVQTWEDDVPLYTHPYEPSENEKESLLKNADHVIEMYRIEIAFLKQQLKAWGISSVEDSIKEVYAKRSKELSNVDAVNTSQECVDKTANNRHEIAAWINRKGKAGEHGYLEWDKDDEAEVSVPLYNHPVKELGYNDIMGTWWETMPNAKSCEGVFEFARAILRKAQEK
jgi:hypothetical protein